MKALQNQSNVYSLRSNGLCALENMRAQGLLFGRQSKSRVGQQADKAYKTLKEHFESRKYLKQINTAQ
jgi:hypothetical protein